MCVCVRGEVVRKDGEKSGKFLRNRNGASIRTVGVNERAVLHRNE